MILSYFLCSASISLNLHTVFDLICWLLMEHIEIWKFPTEFLHGLNQFSKSLNHFQMRANLSRENVFSNGRILSSDYCVLIWIGLQCQWYMLPLSSMKMKLKREMKPNQPSTPTGILSIIFDFYRFITTYAHSMYFPIN